MKITYVINSIKRSGPNQVLLNMVTGLKASKVRIEVVAFFDGDDESEVDKLKKAGAKVTILGVSKSKIVTAGARALGAYLRQSGHVDIVHSHGILSDIAVVRAGFGRIAVTTIHNNMFEDYIFTFGRLKGATYVLLHLFYLRFFKKVVCCSRSAQQKLERYINDVSYAVNGVIVEYSSTENSMIRHDFGIPLSDRVFLYVGKLSAGKNVLGLIADFNRTRLKSEHLIVVGDGELRSECSEIAGEGVHFAGFQLDVAPYYATADVYVSASHSEGFSISVIEALGNDLLLLLSNIPSHREVFDINRSMYIGEIFNGSETFANAKKKLDVLSKETRVYYDKYLTDQAMMREYLTVYQGVVE